MKYMKRCTKCQQEKPLSEFYKRKDSKDGYRSHCKSCMGIYEKERYPSIKKDKQKQRQKYYEDNREKILQSNKDWLDSNKEKRRDYIRSYMKQRYAQDINFKIKHNLRRRIQKAVKQKNSNTMNLLGCDLEKFKAHIASKFQDGMTWENYGKWHIDHIKPCASFDLSDPKQQRECFHYTNLQPLWARDNLIKSNNQSQ